MLFDWDELNFAETSREMVRTGNYLQPTVNYLPHHEKPPLFFWLQSIFMQLFGVSSLTARLPNVLCGLVTFGCLAYYAKQLFPNQQRLYWPMFMVMSLLPAFYFQAGIIDPWFNLFILVGLWPSLTQTQLVWWRLLTSGLLLGLAVLTKGPAAGLIAGLCWLALLVLQPQRRGERVWHYGAIGALALVPGLVWLAALWQVDGGYFAREFLDYQWRLFTKEDAGHGGFPGYHVVVLLLGCFPAAWYALPALLQRKAFATTTDQGMRILFWVVLLLFSIVDTKIVHYSSLCYIPLAYFAARTLAVGEVSANYAKVIRYGLTTTWSLYAVALTLVALAGWLMPQWLPYIKDTELLARLSLPVDWPLYIILPAAVAWAALTWQLYRNRVQGRADAKPQFSERATIGHAETWLTAAGHLTLTTLVLAATLYTIAPRILQYTQGSAVAFFQDQKGKDVFVNVTNYKSYAHHFYADVPPQRYEEGCIEKHCQFYGNRPKPLYFSSKLHSETNVLEKYPDAKIIYRRGGFTFYHLAPTTESER